MDMSVWFLVGAILVFFMQCGFAMVETGFTRAKNAGNIIMKNLMDFCIGTVVFVLLGYGIMNSENYFFGLIGMPEYQMFTSFYDFDWSNFFFQLVFCATAATIVSGAMAERTKFLAYCVYSGFISAIVYPIEAGWVWNSQGWLVVVSQESGYKGIVTVYDNTFSPQIQLHLSSRFVMDAVLSPDSKSLALLTLGLNDNAFESRVDFYQLNRTEEETEPDWTCPVGGDVILAMRWDNSGIWALGETSLSILSTDGTVTGSCNYGDLYLKGFSLDGDGTAVLLLGKFRAGTSAELWVVNADGETQALLSIEEQVLSLSAAGRYVALLTADRLDIYNQDLEAYSTLEGTQGAQTVLQQSDGSAMLIDSTTARLYVP